MGHGAYVQTSWRNQGENTHLEIFAALSRGQAGGVAPDSQVCLHDYDNAEAIVKCTDTDADGRYHFAAPIGARVFVVVDHSNHAFALDKAEVDEQLRVDIRRQVRALLRNVPPRLDRDLPRVSACCGALTRCSGA